jgi:hypothetical protein
METLKEKIKVILDERPLLAGHDAIKEQIVFEINEVAENYVLEMGGKLQGD